MRTSPASKHGIGKKSEDVSWLWAKYGVTCAHYWALHASEATRPYTQPIFVYVPHWLYSTLYNGIYGCLSIYIFKTF